MNKYIFNFSCETYLVLAIVLLNIFIRAVYIQGDYDYMGGGDWLGYNELALRIQSFDFIGYDFTRSPGFPLVMLLSNADIQSLNWHSSDFTNIVFVHMIMGVIASILILYIVKFLTNIKFAVLFSFLYSVFLPNIYYEFFIVTETTAFFTFLLMQFLFLVYLRKKNSNILLLVGLASTMLVLTKPQTIFFPLIIGIYFLFDFFKNRTSIKPIFYYGLPNVLFIGGWMLIFYIYTGTIGLSSLGGNALFSKSEYCCFESIQVSFEDSTKQKLMNLYLEKRQDYIERRPDHLHWTIWNRDLQQSMENQTGLNYAERSKIFGGIAKEAFLNDKKNYFINSVFGFIKQFRITGITREYSPNYSISFLNNWGLRMFFYLCELGYIFSLFYFLFNRDSIGLYFKWPVFYLLFALSLLITQVYFAFSGYGGEGDRGFNFCRFLIVFLGGIFLFKFIMPNFITIIKQIHSKLQH